MVLIMLINICIVNDYDNANGAGNDSQIIIINNYDNTTTDDNNNCYC